MIRVLSTNITSPLGMTTEENVLAVRDRRSGLQRHERPWGLPFDVCASLFSREQEHALLHESACAGGTPTRFEAMVLHSVRDALSRTDIDVSDSKVLLVLSTTKGNIELLDGNGSAGDALFPGTAASRIASELGFVAPPLVVSNACISGVAAQVQAMDLLDSGAYDYAVVVGADCQGAFIVSGFNCLKALSEDPCRPFDMERMGLNLSSDST